MPTYQYACTECGYDFETVQSFTDAALTECPSCHGRLRKVYNAVGIVFKGSGFYRTDSRSSASAADGAKPEKPGSGEKAADKPAAKESASGSSSGSSTTSTSSSSSKSSSSASRSSSSASTTGSAA